MRILGMLLLIGNVICAIMGNKIQIQLFNAFVSGLIFYSLVNS